MLLEPISSTYYWKICNHLYQDSAAEYMLIATPPKSLQVGFLPVARAFSDPSSVTNAVGLLLGSLQETIQGFAHHWVSYSKAS